MPDAKAMARARRTARTDPRTVNIEWFIDRAMRQMNLTLRQRMMVTVQFLQSKIVENISRPVTKTKSKRTGRIVSSDRSKPGEFPKADTTMLKNTIFTHVESDKKGVRGYIGTPLDYGLMLEVSEELDRKYLSRTLNEEIETVRRILAARIT